MVLPELIEPASVAVATGGDVMSNLLIYVGGPLIGIIATLIGIALKRKGAEQSAEDTVYGVASKTIARLTAEVAERDLKITQCMSDIIKLSQQRNESDAHASKATVAAEIAEEAAKRASTAAQDARNEVLQMQAARNRDREYIQSLKSVLAAAGLPVPPEPNPA